MTNDLRWRMEEIQARFELEPTLNDLFVEGEFDKDVIERCLASEGIERVVYCIDCIDVPDTLLYSHHLTSGNKQRVIALARELAKIEENCAYRCLVDRDLDHYFGELEKTKRLIWSAYSSIDLYFFEDHLLHEILIITTKAIIKEWNSYLDSLKGVLHALFVLRLADRQLDLKMNWISYEKCLSRKNSEVQFDRDEYVTRLLNTNAKFSRKDEYFESIKFWEANTVGDPRSSMRGHDFVEILSWSIRKFGGVKDLASNLAVERLFVLLSTRISSLKDLIAN